MNNLYNCMWWTVLLFHVLEGPFLLPQKKISREEPSENPFHPREPQCPARGLREKEPKAFRGGLHVVAQERMRRLQLSCTAHTETTRRHPGLFPRNGSQHMGSPSASRHQTCQSRSLPVPSHMALLCASWVPSPECPPCPIYLLTFQVSLGITSSRARGRCLGASQTPHTRRGLPFTNASHALHFS